VESPNRKSGVLAAAQETVHRNADSALPCALWLVPLAGQQGAPVKRDVWEKERPWVLS